MIFYRFRSTDRLLAGKQELSKQTIFFAHPESLNDPMEGYREIYWHGDEIAWKNLFRHYLLCLERLCLLAILCDEDQSLSPKDIPIHVSMDDFPTPEAKKYFSEIAERFFNNEYIILLLEAILTRTTPTRRDELTFYLSSVHPLAIELILEKHEDLKMIPRELKKPITRRTNKKTSRNKLRRENREVNQKRQHTYKPRRPYFFSTEECQLPIIFNCTLY